MSVNRPQVFLPFISKTTTCKGTMATTTEHSHEKDKDPYCNNASVFMQLNVLYVGQPSLDNSPTLLQFYGSIALMPVRIE